MKTLIGVNCLESVNSFVYASHCQFWVNAKKAFPEDEFAFFTPYRMSIDNMRNTAAKMALEGDYDYLMFIDDDVLVQPNTYEVLRSRDKDIIMALTFVRGWPFKPMFFKGEGIKDRAGLRCETLDFYDDWKDNVWDGLVKCEAVGFSCVLIKVDILKVMEPPYFVTSSKQTEDVYFCCKARYTLNPTPTIFVDVTVPTTHMMMPDGVSAENVESFRKFFDPNEPIGKSRMDRIFDAVKELRNDTA